MRLWPPQRYTCSLSFLNIVAVCVASHLGDKKVKLSKGARSCQSVLSSSRMLIKLCVTASRFAALAPHAVPKSTVFLVRPGSSAAGLMHTLHS